MADASREAEALLPQFQLERLLNQDQAGRRIVLLGTIKSQPAILLAERAAFSTETQHISAFSQSLSRIENLGANDIYSWFLASTAAGSQQPPDLKINLIYPCTEKHIKKYSQQGVRLVTETPEIYRDHVRPYMQRQREEGRLNWVFNIIEGRTEQEDVFYREHGEEGFLVVPDLNWDRKTLTSLHLLGLVERRDIWSVRDLQKKHITWLEHMRERMLNVTVKLYPELEKDQLKLYIHYQPTYYHFHIHIVHVALEAGATQATGKALGLENIISQLKTIGGDDTAGMADTSLTYTLGEASELWTEIYQPLKEEKSA
ncbi:putative mRNA decapping hydrolase [Saccharata proteae CBS 121410]|uniref:mRNA decapping hydrolase n=1 Tax=Saccharata proteae CBS 121410 TaxID=1314787 RepID=A0A9P4LRH5_9PEZI|nr:putative mRNA decapping hydrolase [Saccharata proteae CBS 121410]